MNQTIELLLDHRSIRRYKSEPVPCEMVETIVHCAQMAPTSSHFQAYSIVELTDSGLRDALAEIAGDQRWLREAPLALLFCADLHRSATYFGGVDLAVLQNHECYTVAVIDAALAAQKALVAAQALGLGGVVVGGIRNDIDRVAELCNLPAMVAPLFVLCLGTPDENPDQKPRLPLSLILKQNTYDLTGEAEQIAAYDEQVRQYYLARTGGKTDDTWGRRCGRALMAKTRDEVTAFLHRVGLARR